MELNLENAVDYHYDKFPPNRLDYEQFIGPLVQATDAVARYDQMLKICIIAEYCWLLCAIRRP